VRGLGLAPGKGVEIGRNDLARQVNAVAHLGAVLAIGQMIEEDARRREGIGRGQSHMAAAARAHLTQRSWKPWPSILSAPP
jgi:hypothetical protein